MMTPARHALPSPVAALTLLVLAGGAASAQTATPAPVPASTGETAGIIRVDATTQTYEFLKPWNKKPPETRKGIGAVLENGQVLVTATLVANSTYVELEKATDAVKSPARVVVVDHEANCAVLEPVEDGFLDDITPLPLADSVRPGDMLGVLQLESNGTLAASPARVTTVEVGPYTILGLNFLLYKINTPLQYRDGSFTMPIVTPEGALAGMLIRYDARSQVADLVSAPVLAHFLKDAADSVYKGFPRAGITFSPLRDPSLRRHAGLGDGQNGVYITEVLPDTPAEVAGLKRGDVIVKALGYDVDADGNFTDPDHGELSVSHLLSTLRQVGETAEFEIVRNGVPQTITLTMDRREPEDYPIPPYVIDTAPRYIVVGGLVLQELSRQMLLEWGSNWRDRAPLELVYLDANQFELLEAGRKIVLLSQVLPTAETVGYESLGPLILKRINGRKIHSLESAAAALENPVDGFHRFGFDEDPHEIVIDAGRLEEHEAALKSAYGLSSLRRL